MGNRNLTSGERTGLIVLAIALTAIVAFTSIDYGREEPRPVAATLTDTAATIAADTAAPQPAKRRQPKKKPRKPRPEPPRRNPRSERVDN